MEGKRCWICNAPATCDHAVMAESAPKDGFRVVAYKGIVFSCDTHSKGIGETAQSGSVPFSRALHLPPHSICERLGDYEYIRTFDSADALAAWEASRKLLKCEPPEDTQVLSSAKAVWTEETQSITLPTTGMFESYELGPYKQPEDKPSEQRGYEFL